MDIIMLTTKLLALLTLLYSDLGYQPVITSGYRHPTHPIEAVKAQPGTHTQGIAVDLRCRSDCKVIKQAAQHIGFTGIGMYKDHIHLDIRETPATWYDVSKR